MGGDADLVPSPAANHTQEGLVQVFVNNTRHRPAVHVVRADRTDGENHRNGLI